MEESSCISDPRPSDFIQQLKITIKPGGFFVCIYIYTYEVGQK